MRQLISLSLFHLLGIYLHSGIRTNVFMVTNGSYRNGVCLLDHTSNTEKQRREAEQLEQLEEPEYVPNVKYINTLDDCRDLSLVHSRLKMNE